MRKKIAALTMVAALVLGLSTTALASLVFANTTSANAATSANEFRGCGRGGGVGMMGLGGMMWDDDGNFLTREAFIERLDSLIADGQIAANQRDFFIERYDFCGTYGGGATGTRGGCAVNGGGRGMMSRMF